MSGLEGPRSDHLAGGLRFGVLGPVAVWTADGQPLTVPERKVRALLAVLLVHAGQPVAASRLIDDLWGDQLPEHPANALQTRVSQLRRALAGEARHGRDLVVWQRPGYLLRVEPAAVDAGRFRDLVAQARAAGDPRISAGRLAEALALWRGPAYADFATEPFPRAAIDRLEEERLAALEDQAEARLALGEQVALVGELAGLVVRYPLRPRLRAAYMRALYLAGRPDEALATYADLRDRLAGQLGLDPDPRLAALQRAILRRDPGLAAPVAGGAGPRTNLPAPLTSLIGREGAVEQLRSRLAADRLVTLTGAGGVGKTRLAVEVARQFLERSGDGVWMVELVAIEPRPTGGWETGGEPGTGGGWDAGGGALAGEPAVQIALVRLIAAALGLEPPSRAAGEARPGEKGRYGDAARAGERLVEWLAGAVRDRRALLVLDNCEHVIAPVTRLTELLLRAAPGLRLLATSREPLGIPGEVVWEVPPLTLPAAAVADPADLAGSSAARLFVARAAAAAPGFALTPDNARAVARICRRLDGIPLALELAATRVRGLGILAVADRLDDRFRLLSAGLRGAPERQQTLRAVIDWSWGLLTGPERAVLRRLALFADAWSLAAAEAICAGDGVAAGDVPVLVARLVDRSLVGRVEAPAGVRYRLLESVAAYCLERLHVSGEYEPVQRRHRAYYAELSTRTEPSLFGHGQLFRQLGEAPPAPAGTPPTRPGPAGVRTVRSGDGTDIAYESAGEGPPVVLVGGALNDRTSFGPLVRWLASRFTVVTYDRRGRGASGDAPPYAVARECDDLGAVVAELPGPAYAVGFSSGAVLAVEAALTGVAIAGLALIEPPFILDGTREPMPVDIIDQLDRLIAAGRRGDAVELFLTRAVEMPSEVVTPMRGAPAWPALEAMAHTIAYDVAVMDDFRLPARWAALDVATLVVTGTESAPWRQHAAEATALLLPRGHHLTVDGRSHEAPPEVIGRVLEEWFTRPASVSARAYR